MQKKRILIFHPALAPYRLDFFNKLSEYINLKVIFFRNNLLSQKFDQGKLRNQLICDHGYLLSGFDINSRAFRWGIGKIISDNQPDVIVSTEFSPVTLWLSVIKYFKKYHWNLCVWTDDNIQMVIESNSWKKTVRNIILKQVNSLIVCGNEIGTYYHKIGFNKDAVGISPILRQENNYRRQLDALTSMANMTIDQHLLTNKKVVLFVGRLVEIKGVDRLIGAFSEIRNLEPDAILIIIGDGPEKKKLERQVAKANLCDRVLFMGRLEGDDLLLWYIISCLFVLPSHHEPFGAVVNEALLAGVPVLCSERAGAAGLIRNGYNGAVFDPLSIKILSALMCKWLKKSCGCKNSIKLHSNLMTQTFDNSVRSFVDAVVHSGGQKNS